MGTLPSAFAPVGDWVCAECGDSFRCSACMIRRPARTADDREAVAAALERQASERREPPVPSMAVDAVQILITAAIVVAHVAVIGLSGYGAWYEVTFWGGGVVFVYVVAGLIGAFGVWQSAEGMVDRSWRAVRALLFTVPALVVLYGVLPFLFWSRSGP
jgi:hypothetical protein